MPHVLEMSFLASGYTKASDEILSPNEYNVIFFFTFPEKYDANLFSLLSTSQITTHCSFNFALKQFFFLSLDISDVFESQTRSWIKHTRPFPKTNCSLRLIILSMQNKIYSNETHVSLKEFIHGAALEQGTSEREEEEILFILLIPSICPHGVTDAFWSICGTFVCRKAYTQGQILSVSVPQKVSNTPFCR